MQYTPFTLPIVASGAVAVGTAAFVLRKRARTVAAREFTAAAIAVAVMNFAYAGELSSATLSWKLAWLDVRWVGICAAPLCGVALALRWNGNERWLGRRPLAAMAAIPLVTLLLAWADPLIHFVDGPSVLLPRQGFVLRNAAAGPGFWIFVAYAYACLFIMVGVYGRAVFSSPIRRRQGATLLLATIFPWVANAIYVSGSSPEPGFDVSHVGYGLACLAWAWALGRDRLFDLVPVARDRIFESLVDAVLVLDPEKRIVDHNPAAARLLGASASMVGSPLATLVGSEVAEALVRAGPVNLLGRELQVEASSVRGQGATAAVLTLRDVTLRRQLEVAREEALRLAEDAGRARAQFLARMSHEVRGPLHGVVGAADLLLSAGLEPEPRRYAEAVASSSRLLLALVDELLDFSKIDADRLQVSLADIDARGGLDEVASLFSGAAAKKQLALRIDAPAKAWVRADPIRLRQVLVNLVGNAVKFTDRGEVSIRARREGERLRFEVADTGIGIPESAHAQIFEPFIQIGAAARGGPAGTGLGLAIAKRLVALMGGALRVSSRPGAGSTFWFDLPTVEPARELGARERATPSGPRAGRVLVVDDDKVNRLVTCGLLRREGCEVEEVESAAAALETVERGAFALVITDLRMPGTSGLELTAAVRRLPGQAGRTVVLVLTGDIHDHAREEALGAGANDWIAKPLDPLELRRQLDRWMPRREPAPPPPIDLRSYLAAQPELFARIQQAFRENTPVEVAAMVQAAAAGAWPRLRERAHALKGACAIVGAHELEAACARILSAEGDASRAAVAALEPAALRAIALAAPAPARKVAS